MTQLNKHNPKIRELEGFLVEKQIETKIIGASAGKGIVELMSDYENKKNHFIRLTQSHHPDPDAIRRALDLYMNASDLYYKEKYKVGK